MGNKDDKDTRGLGDIIGDIEKHIDEVEKGSKPAPKKPAPPRKKPAPRPEKPTPAPPSKQPNKERKEVDEATLEKLARVKEAIDRQDPIVRRAQMRTRLLLLIGVLFVIVLFGFIYFLSLDKVEMPFDQSDFNPMDPSAPADSRTGDQFKEERKRLTQAMPKVSAGNPEGLKELHGLVKDSPKSPQAAKALSVLATTYRYQKLNHTESIKAYEELLDKFPEHRDTDRTRKYFIEYLIELGRTKEAREQAEILKEEAKLPRDKSIAESFLKQLP